MKNKTKALVIGCMVVIAAGVVWADLALQQKTATIATTATTTPTSQNQNTGTTPTPTPTPTQTSYPSVTLNPATVTYKSGKKFSLNIPAGYSISVAAQGFLKARFMAMSPDGRLFLAEMASASDTYTGRVFVLSGFNKQSGIFETQNIYLSNLRNPNSLTFYTDNTGQQWLYIALTDKLIRYPYSNGDNSPKAAAQTIATFPDTPHNPPQGYWHLTRTVVTHNNTVYVSVGSSCDLCEETESIRGVILKMNPDGSNQQIIASGLRNAVGIDFAGNDLFATVNQSDKLGSDRPNDIVYKIKEGTNYGWPYCYQFQGAIITNTTQQWTKQFDCSKVPLAWAAVAPHSAPLGLATFDNKFVDATLQNSLLVALHGSGDASIGTGNSVVLVRENTTPVDFISGFYQKGNRLGRPVDVLAMDQQSFFVSDDLNGSIYYLKYNR